MSIGMSMENQLTESIMGWKNKMVTSMENE